MLTSVRSPSIHSTGAPIRFQNSSHSSTLARIGLERVWVGLARGCQRAGAPVGPGPPLRPWPGEPAGTIAAQQRVGLRQARGDRLERVVGAKGLRLLQAGQPE